MATEDPVVSETRAARERLVERFGGDLDALWQHIQQVQKNLDDRIVRRTPKEPANTRKIS
ncbi:MAG TPA: hypothetical protein VNA69_23555 [Thermoanaerobaculia bacterium]|nr:hypothetical protein [Thermoanaerobaculia bacterium]